MSAKWLKLNNSSGNKIKPKINSIILKQHERAHFEKQLIDYIRHHYDGEALKFPSPINELCDTHTFAYYFIEGSPLSTAYSKIMQQALIPRLTLFKTLLLAIQALHQAPIGLIHNDLSPGNILLSQDNDIYIIDFVEAQLLKENAHLMPALVTPRLTKGKPHYTSPEQLNGIKTSVASDIFQLGCLLFDLLFGQQFLNRDDQAQYSFKQLPNFHLAENQTSQQIDYKATQWICEKMLALNPSHRFQSLNECICAIDSLMHSALR